MMNTLDNQNDDFTNTTLKKIDGEFTQQAEVEQQNHERLRVISKEINAEFGFQWNMHATVTLKRQTLSRLLYLDKIYQNIIEVPGVICEFGVHWGATISQLINLRGIYEPFNHSRKIVGFDTFAGFVDISPQDSIAPATGDYSVSKNYLPVLEEILEIQESFSPLGHLKKFELVKGDASETIHQWLSENPHAIISMAIFDMDVYKPTKDVLETILPRLTKGSILVFDELNCPHFPGETIALNEVLGIGKLELKRFPHQPYCAWGVYQGE
jgi:hypothetical protein